MVNETSVIICKSCGREVVRTCIGYYPNKRDKKWVDEDNRLMNGNACGTCHKDKMGNLTRIKKLSRKGNTYE